MKRALLALTASLGLLSAAAQATVINFDSVVGFQTLPSPYNEAGFQFVNSSDSSGAILFWGQGNMYNADPNGNTFSHNYAGTTTTLTRVGGGTFTFNSIDLADVYNDQGSGAGQGGNIQFDFLFADASTSSSTVSIDGLPGFQTFDFGLTDLTQVSWTPLTTYGPWLQLDNVRVDETGNPVPEPASLSLVALALSALAVRRKRS